MRNWYNFVKSSIPHGKKKARNRKVDRSHYQSYFTYRVLKKVITVIGVVILVSFLSLRFIRPPTSSLIIIRSIQSKLGIISNQEKIRREWVFLEEIAPFLQRAVIVAEDARFLAHRGIDLSSLFSVLAGERRRSRVPRGASTITMQTVKNLFLWPGRSYVRKGIELGMSPLFDLIVGKRRILEIYLNIVEWGPGIYGAEAASKYYFGKRAKSLTLNESAALAAVLPSPLTTSPRSMSSAARRRMTRILREVGSASPP